MTATGGTVLHQPSDAIDVRALKRVLVVMLRHHGDVLLTSPVFEALARAAPSAEVDALVYEPTRPMLQFNPRVRQLFGIDRTLKRSSLWAAVRAEWRLARALRRREYDLIVHLTNQKRGAWLARWLAPRWSVAPRLRAPDRFWDGAFTHFYANSSSVAGGAGLARRHTVEQNLDALRRLGIDVTPAPALSMVPGAEAESQAQALLASARVGGEFILIQPTSRWMFKCWPVSANAALIDRLLARGHTVVLSAAPDAAEQRMIQAILERLGPLEARRGRLVLATEGATLCRLAALAARARLFVGIDSAPMHIAAAMGTPTVALFGPSGEQNWGPWQGDGTLRFRVVAHDAFPCRPCGQDGCGGSKVSDCLTTLPVSRVLAAVDQLLLESAPLRAV